MKFPFFFFLSAVLSLGSARAAEATATAGANETVVECAGLFETISTDTEITSTFRDKVVVTGNNLKLTCDYLIVVAIPKKAGATTPAALGNFGYFKSLVATGNVRIVQGDREATCGKAEIFPGEDKIVLSDQPAVRDLETQSSVTGPVIELYRGQRRAVIPAQPGGPGTRITLPEIKDLGYDKNPPAQDEPRKSEPAK